ncbi:MAG: heme-degrading domain-containing protein [Actinomycetota bacterium]|nr:heme-degrading domain-containing protein [Actinomycetota bacterium]
MSDDNHAELLAQLLAQEDDLQLPRFTKSMAWELGERLVSAARDAGHGVTIDIRQGDRQLFHAALEGTAADNDAWTERKKRVVRRFGHSSYYVGIDCLAAGESLEDRYFVDPREYSAHGGAFPITIRDAGIIGTVTVSGLPQAEDHSLVVTVLRDFVTWAHEATDAHSS